MPSHEHGCRCACYDAGHAAGLEKHGPKCDVARRRGRSEEALAAEQMRAMRDGCEICHGSQGGVQGNENRLDDGTIVCDYCHAFWLKAHAAGVAQEREACHMPIEEAIAALMHLVSKFKVGSVDRIMCESARTRLAALRARETPNG